MSTDMYSEYPTDQQIEELLDAHRKGGPAAIAEVLRKRRTERTEAVKANDDESLLTSLEQRLAEATPISEGSVTPRSVTVSVNELNRLLDRNAQLEDERRNGFWYQVNESLHNPGDRLAWSMVFFVVSIALTLPFLPGGAAFFVSGIVAAIPAAFFGKDKH
jgi:hypothetical protein